MDRKFHRRKNTSWLTEERKAKLKEDEKRYRMIRHFLLDKISLFKKIDDKKEKKKFRRTCENFKLSEQVELLKYDKTKRKTWRRVLETIDEIQEKLEESHSRIVSGKLTHYGEKITFATVTQDYWWNSMSQDVNAYVRSCKECSKKRKLVNRDWRKPKFETNKVTGPLERFYVDIIGPLPETAGGSKYILSCTDNWTKFIMLRALKDITVTEIAKKLKSCLLVFGPPDKILIDQGETFNSLLKKELDEEKDTKEVTTTEPESHYTAQKMNDDLKSKISSHFPTDQNLTCNTWDQQLEEVAFKLNSSPDSRTGHVPLHLMFMSPVNTIQETKILDHESQDNSKEDDSTEIYIEKTKILSTAVNRCFYVQSFGSKQDATIQDQDNEDLDEEVDEHSVTYEIDNDMEEEEGSGEINSEVKIECEEDGYPTWF